MRRRSTQIIHGFGCLLLLLAIIAAPPLLLATLVGWPLPTANPNLDTVDTAVRSGITDATIVKGLACIAWISWAQIAASILVDLVAVIRGGVTPHAPVLPGIQLATGRLVAGATVLFSLLAPGPRIAGAMPTAPPPATATVLPAGPPQASRAAAADPAPAPAPAPADKTWAVQRHDSYWSIAERTLGDGMLWREIRDANIGRQMPGGQIVTAQSDMIAPGWSLALPGDALVDAAAPGTADPATSPSAGPVLVVAEPGDSLWSIAEDRATTDLRRPATDVEIRTYWTDLLDSNQQLADPNVLHVGEPVRTPAAMTPAPPPPAPVPSAPAPAPVPPAPPPTAPRDEPAEAGVVPPTREETPEEDRVPTGNEVEREADPGSEADDGNALNPEAIVGLLGVAGTGIAYGATRAVRRRRRTRPHRPARPATRAAAETRDTHRVVLAVDAEDGHAVDQLRFELDSLAIAVAAGGQTCRPRIVQVGADHIDVVLDRTAVPAPSGWRAEGSGTAWVKDELEPIVEGGPECFSTPLLVAIGSPDDAGQLHLDLEAEGLLTLAGEEEAVEGLVRSWLTELATTPLAENLQVHVVGDVIPDDLMLYDRVQHFDTWDSVLTDLRARSQQTSDLLTANNWASTFAARGAGSEHDALAPVAVIGAPPTDASDLRALHEIGLGAVAVVMVGGDEVAGTEVRCEGEKLRIPSIGLECTAQSLSAEATEALVALVNEDEDLSEDARQLSLLVDPPSTPERSLRRLGPYEDPDHQVLIRLLGNIAIIGGNRPLRGKHAAVVAYIALHGQATPGALIDAVWSGTNNPNRRKRLANIVSECRSALGAQHLPQAADGIYRAGPGLMTDTELFNRRVAYAATQAPADAAVTLQGALDLVADVVFTYQLADQQSFSWIDLDNLQERWGQKVASVAESLADLYLEAGDTTSAIAAGNAALAVLPANTELTEQLMRAHHAAGDRLAIQRVYLAHLAALEALDFDAPEQSTAELHDRLVG